MTSLFSEMEKHVISIPLTFDEPWAYESLGTSLGTLHDVIMDAAVFS
jgi:hypothetical protein